MKKHWIKTCWSKMLTLCMNKIQNFSTEIYKPQPSIIWGLAYFKPQYFRKNIAKQNSSLFYWLLWIFTVIIVSVHRYVSFSDFLDSDIFHIGNMIELNKIDNIGIHKFLCILLFLQLCDSILRILIHLIYCISYIVFLYLNEFGLYICMNIISKLGT